MTHTYRNIIIALVVVALIAAAAIAYNVGLSHEEAVEPEPLKEQVVVECRVKSFTDIGILVELSEESAFSTLLVEINNDDLPDRFNVGNYIDVYYDGIIIDASPAKFHIIYDIVQASEETTEQKTYTDWNIPNILIDDLEEEELAAVTTTIQSYLSTASNKTLVDIYSILGSLDVETGVVDAYLCKVKYNDTGVDEWQKIYLLKNVDGYSVIKTEALELMIN